jgi:hypothetical protein
LRREGQLHLDGIYRSLGVLPGDPKTAPQPSRPVRVSGTAKKARARRTRVHP